MQANGVDDQLAQTYWRFAIVPTRSCRVQEGYQFNRRSSNSSLIPKALRSAARAVLYEVSGCRCSTRWMTSRRSRPKREGGPVTEPAALIEMNADERQLLKEAVCDAILERTRRMVSGDGEVGGMILGAKPSRVLSSGFVLPRIDEDGDDESSDIRLAAHGLDFRLRAAPGTLQITPSLAVYVRVLPSAEDLFARGGRLIPRAELSEAAAQRAKGEVSRRLAQQANGVTGRARRDMRNRHRGAGLPRDGSRGARWSDRSASR